MTVTHYQNKKKKYNKAYINFANLLMILRIYRVNLKVNHAHEVFLYDTKHNATHLKRL